MKIAICDDNKDELIITEKIVNTFLKQNKINSDIKLFTHPDQFYNTVEKERFDIYILDIVMPMISGIEIGKEIRKNDKEAQIIYITSEPSFALESFCANPINYIIKPIKSEILFDTLEYAISRISNRKEEIILIRTKDNLRSVAINSIMCCERVNRKARYTLLGGETIDSLTMSGKFSEQVEPLLLDSNFILTHISYVVNIQYIQHLFKDEVIIKGGIHIPVSKKQYANLQKAYLDYNLLRR